MPILSVFFSFQSCGTHIREVPFWCQNILLLELNYGDTPIGEKYNAYTKG